MKSLLIGMVLALSATQAHADASAFVTPYDTLQKLFSDAQAPAEMADFDMNTDKASTQKCVAAKPSSKTPYPIFFVRYTVVVKGEAPQGPLFPGTPDTLQDVILVNEQSRNHLDRNADFYARGVTVSSSPTELVETIVDESYVTTPRVLRARKSGNLIAIEYGSKSGLATDVTIYAYCFR